MTVSPLTYHVTFMFFFHLLNLSKFLSFPYKYNLGILTFHKASQSQRKSEERKLIFLVLKKIFIWIQNNIIIVLSDMCVRYASLVDPLIPQMTACLKESRFLRENLHLRQWCGSGSGRVRIHLGPWIRIRIQRYKMKGKAEFSQKKMFFFVVGNYIFRSMKLKMYLIWRYRFENMFFFLDC